MALCWKRVRILSMAWIKLWRSPLDILVFYIVMSGAQRGDWIWVRVCNCVMLCPLNVCMCVCVWVKEKETAHLTGCKCNIHSLWVCGTAGTTASFSVHSCRMVKNRLSLLALFSFFPGVWCLQTTCAVERRDKQRNSDGNIAVTCCVLSVFCATILNRKNFVCFSGQHKPIVYVCKA